MSRIRLYRTFYVMTPSPTGGTVNTLINPFQLSATTQFSGSTTVIETLVPIQESTGKYYVDLNPNLYSFDMTYELDWKVNYLSNTPQKILLTFFKVDPTNITTGPLTVHINY